MKEETLCQGERLSDKEIDGLILSLNNVWRIVYQLRSDLTEARRLLTMTADVGRKSEPVDVGQIEGFLNRKW